MQELYARRQTYVFNKTVANEIKALVDYRKDDSHLVLFMSLGRFSEELELLYGVQKVNFDRFCILRVWVVITIMLMLNFALL